MTDHIRSIFRAGLAAVEPGQLVRDAIRNMSDADRRILDDAKRIIVVGAGKASGAMVAELEACLGFERMTGLVNVPEGTSVTTKRVRLHFARPAGHNHPTHAGVLGSCEMLQLLQSAGPDDVAIALISGGGSALMPCPIDGITLEDKQSITKRLHACGATIVEMNTVRKHLSAIKGGRMAEAFSGQRFLSFVLSDVVGNPLDVIASGPTVPDPTTYADALSILTKYRIDRPQAVLDFLQRGLDGHSKETPKSLPESCRTIVIGSNATALKAAKTKALELGYSVLDLGSDVEGESREVAQRVVDIIRRIRDHGEPVVPPACVIFGGETTVTLGPNSGRGGRNQELVLATMDCLGRDRFAGITVLSAGTDGEDGPTDAAGAVASMESFDQASCWGLSIREHLDRHDAYPFFERTGGLLKTGLTGTNVMDLGIVLIQESTSGGINRRRNATPDCRSERA